MTPLGLILFTLPQRLPRRLLRRVPRRRLPSGARHAGRRVLHPGRVERRARSSGGCVADGDSFTDVAKPFVLPSVRSAMTVEGQGLSILPLNLRISNVHWGNVP